jgi:hypothetical protein
MVADFSFTFTIVLRIAAAAASYLLAVSTAVIKFGILLFCTLSAFSKCGRCHQFYDYVQASLKDFISLYKFYTIILTMKPELKK